MLQDLETSTTQKRRDKELWLHVLKVIRELVGDKNYVVLTNLHRRAINPPSWINVPNPSRILMCVNPIS